MPYHECATSEASTRRNSEENSVYWPSPKVYTKDRCADNYRNNWERLEDQIQASMNGEPYVIDIISLQRYANYGMVVTMTVTPGELVEITKHGIAFRVCGSVMDIYPQNLSQDQVSDFLAGRVTSADSPQFDFPYR